MDLLTQKGELTAEDLAELQGLEKDELVALVTRLNRGWYQLLEELEDAHRADLKRLTDKLTAQFNVSLTDTTRSLDEKIKGYQKELAASEKESKELSKTGKENAKRLDTLKGALEKLTKGSSDEE